MAATTMSLEDVPIGLRKLAIAAATTNSELPAGERDQTPDHMLAAVLPTHEHMVRDEVSRELREFAGVKDREWAPLFYEGVMAASRAVGGSSVQSRGAMRAAERAEIEKRIREQVAQEARDAAAEMANPDERAILNWFAERTTAGGR